MSNNLFNDALAVFLASVNEDQAKHYERFETLDFGEGEDCYAGPVKPDGGNKYLKLTQKNGCQTHVYAFVATVDVPNKNVKAGDVLMAATWKAPALKRKVPAVANIFDPESFLKKQKGTASWLYA